MKIIRRSKNDCRSIAKCAKQKKYIGICGQAPSDYPEFADFLIEKGIESMSLNPDTVIKNILRIAKKGKAVLILRKKIS